MTTRSIKQTVTFTGPFVLGDSDEVLPAGGETGGNMAAAADDEQSQHLAKTRQ